MKKNPDISVVIPVYNSSKILPILHHQLQIALEKTQAQYEIIFVNDCSQDDSWDVINELTFKFEKIKALSLRKNVGQHNSIMAGLDHATGDVLILMDDDLQHNPDDLIKLYEAIIEGNDVCFISFDKTYHPLWKKIGSAINDLFARLLLSKPAEIYLSSYKAFKKEISDEIIKYQGPYPYIDGLLLMTTSSLASVNGTHRPRHYGESNYTFLKSLSLWTKMATSFSVLPLRLAGMFGFVLAFSAFILAITTIFIRLTYADINFPTGWASTIIVILAIGGFQLIALGIIGEYVGRSYTLLNNLRPFSIEKKINF